MDGRMDIFKEKSENIRKKITHQAFLILKKIKPSCSRELTNQETKLLLCEYRLNEKISPETEAKIEAVHERLKNLSKRQMEIVRLAFWEGKTRQEISDIAGISQSRVSQIMNEALEALRR